MHINGISHFNLLNKILLENNKSIDKLELIKSVDKSEELISFMSDTIETFKHFYSPSNENQDFLIHECVIDVLSIVEATFYYDGIKIFIQTHEKENVFGNVNEFSQVIFSILNNARDMFKIKEIQNPEIHIEIEDKKISISDNAGGIDEDIIDDIFLPFISSHEGTGSGLYLSKNLIEKNNATISASNKKDGANFTIEFLTWIN